LDGVTRCGLNGELPLYLTRTDRAQ
jgi:hypothetical protein